MEYVERRVVGASHVERAALEEPLYEPSMAKCGAVNQGASDVGARWSSKPHEDNGGWWAGVGRDDIHAV